jgi:DNA-binding IclR family transcriptional regulator
LSTSTAATILGALDAAGYAERQADKSYRLGPGLLRLVDGLRRRYPLLGAADVELGRLASELDCGVTLARITTDSLEVILTAGSTEELDNRAGHRVPLDAPYGAVAMAWQEASVIDEWLATSEPGGGEERRQRALLDGIRARGYAVYGIPNDAHTAIAQIHDLLASVSSDAGLDAVRSQLSRLAGMVGGRIFTTDELTAGGHRPVSYVIAPVFGADAQPRYLVSLHLFRDAMSNAELDRCRDHLLACTRLLTAYVAGDALTSPSTGNETPLPHVTSVV